MSPLSAISPPLAGYNMSLPADLAPAQLPSGPLREIQSAGAPAEAGPLQPAGESFANVLGRIAGEANQQQQVASDALTALQSGQNVSLHQAVIAMEEANVSFQLMVEVRNRLLDSYQEIMRMQT